jgi:hypothetical protein
MRIAQVAPLAESVPVQIVRQDRARRDSPVAIPGRAAHSSAQLDAIAEVANQFDIVHCHTDWAHLLLLRRLGVPHLIDRLGRSLKDLADISHEIEKAGANLKVLEQPVDTSTSAGRAFFGMLAVFAAFETDIRRERQAEGIEPNGPASTVAG